MRTLIEFAKETCSTGNIKLRIFLAEDCFNNSHHYDKVFVGIWVWVKSGYDLSKDEVKLYLE